MNKLKVIICTIVDVWNIFVFALLINRKMFFSKSCNEICNDINLIKNNVSVLKAFKIFVPKLINNNKWL